MVSLLPSSPLPQVWHILALNPAVWVNRGMMGTLIWVVIPAVFWGLDFVWSIIEAFLMPVKVVEGPTVIEAQGNEPAYICVTLRKQGARFWGGCWLSVATASAKYVLLRARPLETFGGGGGQWDWGREYWHWGVGQGDWGEGVVGLWQRAVGRTHTLCSHPSPCRMPLLHSLPVFHAGIVPRYRRSPISHPFTAIVRHCGGIDGKHAEVEFIWKVHSCSPGAFH